MKQPFLVLFSLLFIGNSGYSNETVSTKDSEEKIEELASHFERLDSIEKTIEYKHGEIWLENGHSIINIPEGFKFGYR